MIVQRTFEESSASVPEARHFAAAALRGMPTEFVDAVVLMVSELATNAVQHGRSRFQVVIDSEADEVRVDVSDDGAGDPTPRTPSVTDLRGRGLQIVRALADEWGVGPSSGYWQKSIWFTLRLQHSQRAR